MAWYRVNTCSLTSGSPAINGASTAWVANAQAGDAFKGPDEKLYEVQSVNSDTSITLASNYTGTTAALQAYAIITLGQRHASQPLGRRKSRRIG